MSKSQKIAVICVVAFLVIAIAIITPLLYIWLEMPTLDGGARVMAYITAESIERLGIDSFDFSHVTHLIYAFSYVNDGTFDIVIDEPEFLEQVENKLRIDNPDAKLMLAIRTVDEFAQDGVVDGLCNGAHTEQNRKKIVENCIDVYNEYGIDGFDLDWEYPTMKSQSAKACNDCDKDHANLLEDLRNGLPNGALLSFAAGIRFLSFCYDNTRLAKIVDFVNVMNYDFSTSRNSPFSESKINTFNYLVEGYSKAQINWGVPFYARSNNPEYEFYSYRQILQLANDGQAEIVEGCDVTYAIYNGAKLSFDTYNMIEKKVKYVKQHGYGGVFCWHLAEDSQQGELMKLMWDILKK